MRDAVVHKYSIVGKPLPRVDAIEKALGTAEFTDDVLLPGALVGRVLRSPVAHGRIRSIDVEAAGRLPGVHAVLTGADIPDVLYGDFIKDRRVIALDKVRHVGEPVALVAAEHAAIAEAALGLIDVKYEELPAHYDPFAALAEGSVLLHDDVSEYEATGKIERWENVCTLKVNEIGDPAAAWEEVENVIEGTYITPEAHAAYIEPHSALASVDRAGRVTVWTPTQGTFRCRENVARVMGLPPSRVKVIPTEVGGGFGGKMSTLVEPLAALLAGAAGRPVKVTLSREEDFEGTTPRHATVTHSRLGADGEGNILVREVDFYMDSGAYADLAPMVANARAQMALGPYRIPNARVRVFAVYTNKPGCGIVRAPAGPQLTFVTESQIDELARRTGRDPYDLRVRNALRRGDRGMEGEVKFNVCLPQTLERAREAAGKPSANGDGRLYGRGVASGFWRGIGGASSCNVRLDDDGTVRIVTGSVDISGSSTSILQIVAEELGLAHDRVSIVTADTDSAAYSPGSGGSQVTRSVGTSAQRAARVVRKRVLEAAARKLEVHVNDLILSEGRVTVSASPDRSLSLAQVAAAAKSMDGPIFGHGATANLPLAPVYTTQVADVAVDPETGEVEVLRVVAVQDVGFAINPLSVEGQIEGGVLQGVGYALMEEMRFEQGRIVNPDLEGYLLPAARDAVEVVPVLVEEPAPEGAFGARGVGEPPIVCTAAAVANAVFEATGVRVTELPITPERVRMGLRRLQANVEGSC